MAEASEGSTLAMKTVPHSETTTPSAISKLMSLVISDDDLLVEILIRLPDYRCVVQCGLVCKRWFSLIFRCGLYFSHAFNHHHRQKRQLSGSNPLPYTIFLTNPLRHGHMFLTSYDTTTVNLFSKKSKILHGEKRVQQSDDHRSYLEFLGLQDPMIISSCDDLLLVRIGRESRYIICNPLTKQWFALPQRPRSYFNSYGLVCKPNSTTTSSCCKKLGLHYCNCTINFRVVLIGYSKTRRELVTTTFSSETGQWNKSSFFFPLFRWFSWPLTAYACNGILYWPLCQCTWQGILALNPFKDEAEEGRCRLIRLPDEIPSPEDDIFLFARLGVVQGRLRLSEFEPYSHRWSLKTWELNDLSRCDNDHDHGGGDDADWLLVHDVEVKKADKLIVGFFLGLHPEDGDVIFFICNLPRGSRESGGDRDTGESGFYRYHVKRDSFEKICDVPYRDFMLFKYCRSVFTIVHPWLPTKIPELPCV
ncbi:F-box domain containing protein [Trema orientale]|uniref:F-box domain containing protein n=1 Tax=Trema orientale TaxID=63057 RepID=A0A2P5EA51_TREOI|nr:F-box domain containing protein [Trema orientale]